MTLLFRYGIFNKSTTKFLYLLRFRHRTPKKPPEVINRLPKLKPYPEPPTTCCMTNCPECVWLDYAEDLTDFFEDEGEKAEEEIRKQIPDPSLKQFVIMELRLRRAKNNF